MSCVGNPAAIPAADHVNGRLFSTTLTRVVDPLLPRVPRTQARKDITSPNDDIWNSLTIFVTDHSRLCGESAASVGNRPKLPIPQ